MCTTSLACLREVSLNEPSLRAMEKLLTSCAERVVHRTILLLLARLFGDRSIDDSRNGDRRNLCASSEEANLVGVNRGREVWIWKGPNQSVYTIGSVANDKIVTFDLDLTNREGRKRKQAKEKENKDSEGLHGERCSMGFFCLFGVMRFAGLIKVGLSRCSCLLRCKRVEAEFASVVFGFILLASRLLPLLEYLLASNDFSHRLARKVERC